MLFEKDYNKQMEHNYFIFIAFTMHEKLQIYKKTDTSSNNSMSNHKK